tara:strand:+ start:313 stop:540 length:228 start_codon:yes stop_codon:yes gene_type:complete
MSVFVLKIRLTGEEDEVFVFSNAFKALKAAYQYFELDVWKAATPTSLPCAINDQEVVIVDGREIGYFSIFKLAVL